MRPSKPPIPAGRYDPAERRRGVRKGRERGCWVYIPLEELSKAGIDPNDPPPDYRIWGDERGGVVVRLYRREPE